MVNVHISLNHPRVLESQSIVDVHIARKLQFRIPELHYWYLCMRHTNHSLHSIYSIISKADSKVSFEAHTVI